MKRPHHHASVRWLITFLLTALLLAACNQVATQPTRLNTQASSLLLSRSPNTSETCPANNPQFVRASKFVIPAGESWTIDQLALYFSGGSGDASFTIYQDNAGTPGPLLQSLEIITAGPIDNNNSGRTTFDVTPFTLETGTYWLGYKVPTVWNCSYLSNQGTQAYKSNDDGATWSIQGGIFLISPAFDLLGTSAPTPPSIYKITTGFPNITTVSKVRLQNGMVSTTGSNYNLVYLKGRSPNYLDGYARTKNGKLFFTKHANGTAPNAGGGYLIYDFSKFNVVAPKTIQLSGVTTKGGTVSVFADGYQIKRVNIPKNSGAQTLDISAPFADWVQVKLTGPGYADNLVFEDEPAGPLCRVRLTAQC